MVANLAKENHALKAELERYKPVMVVAANGKISEANKVSSAERDMRIAAINFVAALPMFKQLNASPQKRLARYIETCQLNNKIDPSITINHFQKT